jgi:hypothetical protein
VGIALNSLEKLKNLKEFLPRADRRRGLIDAGGRILKALFGTAVVTDLDELHNTIEALHKKEDVIAHSLNQQVTYLRQLDGTVKFNFQAIANLSDALKKVTSKAQQNFKDVATQLAWYNKRQQAATALRQLELALTELENSLDELIHAMQFVLLGKVPMNLIGPNVEVNFEKHYYGFIRRLRANSRTES